MIGHRFGHVRIVGGSLSGRVLRAPPGAATRPTSEKVREAVFNILGNVEGAEVLDRFKHDTADLDDLATKRALKVLITELEEVRADERFAVSMLARVDQTAAAL